MGCDGFRRIRAWHRLTAFTVASCLLALPARGDIIDRVLAVAGGDLILLSDVQTVTIFGLLPDAPDETDALTWLIDRTLTLAEVNRFIVPAPEAGVIDADLADVRGRFSTPEEFQRALAAVGMTETELARVVRDNRRIDSYLRQRFGSALQPTEAALARYYRDYVDRYSVGEVAASFDRVRAQVQRDLQEERRQALIADWVDRLRLRATVIRLDEDE